MLFNTASSGIPARMTQKIEAKNGLEAPSGVESPRGGEALGEGGDQALFVSFCVAASADFCSSRICTTALVPA